MTAIDAAAAGEGTDWEVLSGWWTEEVAADSVFDTDVLPLLRDLVSSPTSGVWLDVGCGEGRVMRSVGVPTVGCDIAAPLLKTAVATAPVVRSRLPDLDWAATGAFAGAYVVLTLEHIDNAESLFRQLRRVVSGGGTLVVVANHPSFTAERSGPIVDLDDGEVLWRWGAYFDETSVSTPIDGDQHVTFHHRGLGSLLTLAGAAGWRLERCEERALSSAAVEMHPGYAGQEAIPRLLGLRWRAD